MTTLPRTHCGRRLAVIDGPSFLDATGLPFVFDSRCLRAACPKARRRASPGALQCPSTGRGAGLRRDLMLAGNGVFG